MMHRRLLIVIGVCVVGFLIVNVINGLFFLRDGKLHIIFCDVGQGDGILIKTPRGKVITVDGGPDESMSNCLANRLPLWQRKIDLMALTHPHIDHFAGDIPLLSKYTINTFITEDLTSEQKAYQLLLSMIKDKKVHHQILHIGDTYKVGEVELQTVGPSRELLQRSSPKGEIGESKEFASLLLVLRFGKFSLLLPGDSQAPEMEEAIKTFGLKEITVLQSPHHGSATGVNDDIVNALRPKVAIVSVGAHNRYHHPSPSTLKLYADHDISVKRTDQLGTIEIISDGKSYQVR